MEIRSLIKTEKPQIVFHRFTVRRLSHMRRLFGLHVDRPAGAPGYEASLQSTLTL